MTALTTAQIAAINKSSRAMQNGTVGTRIADLEAANPGSDMFPTAGTVTASKAVVVDADKHIDTISIAEGGLKIGAGAGTAMTSSAAELNLLDGSVAGTAVGSKALALGANRNVDYIVIADGGLRLGAVDGTSVTSTAAELNYSDIQTLGTGAASKAVVLDSGEDYTWPATGILTYGILKDPAGTSLTATTTELNFLDNSVAGTSVASKALVLGANKNTDVLALPVSGLKIGSGAGTAVSASAAELNVNTGVTAGAVTASKTVVAGAAKNLDTLSVALPGFGAAGVEAAITAHAGGTQAAAQALSASKSVHLIATCATAADSVILPAATGTGTIHIIHNDGVASCQLYAALTETIDNIASATGVAIAAGKTSMVVDVWAGSWISLKGS